MEDQIFRILVPLKGRCLCYVHGRIQSHSGSKRQTDYPCKVQRTAWDEFVVTKGLDGCLFVYTKEEWHNIEEKFRGISMTSKDARKFSRFFFAGAGH